MKEEKGMKENKKSYKEALWIRSDCVFCRNNKSPASRLNSKLSLSSSNL